MFSMALEEGGLRIKLSPVHHVFFAGIVHSEYRAGRRSLPEAAKGEFYAHETTALEAAP